MKKYSTIHQHEPLRTPEGWTGDKKRFIAQLEEIFDDIYRRFGRLDLSDLSAGLRKTLSSQTETVNGVVDRVAKVEANSEQFSVQLSEKVTQQQVESTVAEATQDFATKDEAQGYAGAAEDAANAATDEKLKGYSTTTEMQSAINQTAQEISLEVSKKVTQEQVDESIDGIDEFHNSAVDITADGIKMNTTGSIRAIVDDVERLTIDETGVNAPLIMADEVHAGNLVEKHLSATAEWKGGIQKSLDALPKYLTQDTTLTVPAGTYAEDVVIKGFMGSKLTVKLSAGVTINGTVRMSNCMDIELSSDYLGNAFIYPRSSSYYVVAIYKCHSATLSGLYISGYRGRTASVAGSSIGVEVYCSNVRIYYACIEYTSSYAYYHDSGTFFMENVIGGSEGSDAATNANLGQGVFVVKGAHGAIYGRCPLSVSGYGSSIATLLTSSPAPTAGGMTYTEPEYVTQSFTISKHCTYLYGVKRIRDDQATTFSQGYYGTYASGNNNWRIGAMWFADAASALAGKTIKSAKLTMRRASGGWSNAVPVYLGTVALAESSFTSTLTPAFTKASTYPIANLARETEATYDVTALMSAIQAGQAIGVFEPRSEYSSSFSPAYTNFYGLGSGYEPVLTVEYK